MKFNKECSDMFWDIAAGLYDVFEDVYNGKVNRELCIKVSEIISEKDNVIECACGTGMITRYIAAKCRMLTATDYSSGMLRKAEKKCEKYNNIRFRKTDIMNIKCRDNAYDAVVAGNVIHLLDDPYAALKELERICRPGGKIIIPTYINKENEGSSVLFVKLLEKFGAGFKRQFSFETYKEFFAEAGYSDVKFSVINGRMSCVVAVITKTAVY